MLTIAQSIKINDILFNWDEEDEFFSYCARIKSTASLPFFALNNDSPIYPVVI